MLGHIKHLQLSEGDCGFQSSNHRDKIQNNGNVPFFLALSRALQDFHCYLRIPQDLLIFVAPHSVSNSSSVVTPKVPRAEFLGSNGIFCLLAYSSLTA